MKKILLIIFLFSINYSLLAQVNGIIEVVSGKKVLTIWGTHQERGFAHGYIAGEGFKTIFDDFFVNEVCVGSVNIYKDLRKYFTSNFSIEKKYLKEASAFIEGMLKSGVRLNNPILEKDIDATDVLMFSALPDLNQIVNRNNKIELGCASMSNWGSSTIEDPLLGGHLIITRLLDWSTNAALKNNHLLIVNIPTEKDEQKWISIAFSGFLGSLSAINESSVAAFMNGCNTTGITNEEEFHPILLSVRNGIEMDDYNHDSKNNAVDVLWAVQNNSRSCGAIIHVVKDEGLNSNPVIIECDNQHGIFVRSNSSDTSIPANHLIATNHFRGLCSSVTCYRYIGIMNSLKDDYNISPERSWKIFQRCACLNTNLHAIQYIQSANQIRWAASKEGSLAIMQEPTKFNIQDLFVLPNRVISDAEEYKNLNYIIRQNYPNPFNPTTAMSFKIPKNEHVTLKVFDILGNEIELLVDEEKAAGTHEAQFDADNLPSGVYLYKLTVGDFVKTKKMLLLK